MPVLERQTIYALGESYFGVYFPIRAATKEINVKTLERAHKKSLRECIHEFISYTT